MSYFVQTRWVSKPMPFGMAMEPAIAAVGAAWTDLTGGEASIDGELICRVECSRETLDEIESRGLGTEVPAYVQP